MDGRSATSASSCVSSNMYMYIHIHVYVYIYIYNSVRCLYQSDPGSNSM